MSRFFRGGDDSSSESSSDEEELYSTEEEEEDQEDQEESSEEEEEEEESSDDEAGPAKTGLSRFLVDQASSESEASDDEGATKVKSATDKRFDELEATITAIQNGQKINDWGSIANGMFSAWAPHARVVSLTKCRVRQAQSPGR
jgi:translation initiation factor 3 subunit C